MGEGGEDKQWSFGGCPVFGTRDQENSHGDD